jgi:hypothetical protein
MEINYIPVCIASMTAPSIPICINPETRPGVVMERTKAMPPSTMASQIHPRKDRRASLAQVGQNRPGLLNQINLAILGLTDGLSMFIVQQDRRANSRNAKGEKSMRQVHFENIVLYTAEVRTSIHHRRRNNDGLLQLDTRYQLHPRRHGPNERNMISPSWCSLRVGPCLLWTLLSPFVINLFDIEVQEPTPLPTNHRHIDTAHIKPFDRLSGQSNGTNNRTVTGHKYF